jgi:hypothetical protein
MIRLALELPVFIASPGDVAEERESVDETIRKFSEKALSHGIVLRPYLWEKHGSPGYGPPQDIANKELEWAELVVVIFGLSAGSTARPDADETGTEEELRLALGMAASGLADNVFVYFRSLSQLSDEEEEKHARVSVWREKFNTLKTVTYSEFSTVAEFRIKFECHFGRWLDHWLPVPSICQFTMTNRALERVPANWVGENRTTLIRRYLCAEEYPLISRWLGKIATTLYQQGCDTESTPDFQVPKDVLELDGFRGFLSDYEPSLDRQILLASHLVLSYKPLIRLNQASCRFASPEWFYFFCAYGLLQSIKDNDTSATERLPYVNHIHQHLAGLVTRESHSETDCIIKILRSWLRKSFGKSSPITRNFAAYVLGMIGAKTAEDDLAWAAKSDRGTDVRRYSLMSLGKLRSRKHLDLLVEAYQQEPDMGERLFIGMAICRTIGIVSYEL